ncbi:MAG TPA: hypothetical protein VFX58_01500 [Chitinophagaceae bacterium]|nr:hypothetical protein [Chitinophagaceae bacterium]
MKHKTFIYLSFFLSVILFACSKDNNPPSQQEIQPEEQITANNSVGATQISGIGFYATVGECDYESQGAVYAIRMTGDLEGCLYAFIDDFECSPSGTYREVGREYFVGTYNGQPGTFRTTYKFEAKYEDCEGGPLGAEIFGRCQHPIVAGSGTGVFNGVSGQLNFKDDIQAGNFPYRGRLQF